MSEFPVYLVDDDESVRRSVGFMLKTSGIDVHSYPNGMEFLKVTKHLDPGCVLLDIRMPGVDGLEVQAQLNERGVTYPVVVMTGHGDVELAVRAMKAGAIDFIEKPFDKSVMIQAIEEGFNRLGNSSDNGKRQVDAQLQLNALTAREHDVLNGLVKGHPNKTIGYDLGISPRTVEIHRANLMRKLDVHNLSDLLRIAFAAGMGEGTED
ncbi:response regulator FixJ [Alteraurantiacibacter aestuarii]|uniref:response regulator transcription factor n=1 Tax=Alteraurantiacibacter aestuarii TaxID=650004 RepID=UPI0031D3F95D